MSAIPFPLAVVCLNPECEHVSDSPSDLCPVCGFRGLMNLATVLGSLHTPHVAHFTTLEEL